MRSPAYQPITSQDDWFVGIDRQFIWVIYNEVTRAKWGDITGWSIQTNFGTDQDGPTILSVFGTVLDGPNSLAQTSVSASQTSGLTPATLWYMTTGAHDGLVETIAYGPAVLKGRPL